MLDFNDLIDLPLANVTRDLGFLEIPTDRAVSEYLSWMGPIVAGANKVTDRIEINGTLRTALEGILPLRTIRPDKFLFIPLSNGWTAYFENMLPNPDPFSTISYLSDTIGCRGVRAAVYPNVKQSTVILEVYSRTARENLNIERSLCIHNDSGPWVFESNGTAQEFEELELYEDAQVANRFNEGILYRYLSAMGIEISEESNFDTTDGEPAVLITLTSAK